MVIGTLEAASRERTIGMTQGFHEGMAALGWNLGVQHEFEGRCADGRVKPVFAEAAQPQDIERTVGPLVGAKAQALVVMPSVRFDALMKIIASAGAERWPVVGVSSAIIEVARRQPIARRSASISSRSSEPGSTPSESASAWAPASAASAASRRPSARST